MRAAIFDAPFAIRMADAPKPEPRAGEVLVRVKAAGLCAGCAHEQTDDLGGQERRNAN
jgi:D-arabinose 1-dehydrogenase-like Zn-dependent alcohol dehydrogenase